MNNISPTSRNKREGTYKGKKCNKHFRSAKKYTRAKRTIDMIFAEHASQVVIDDLRKRINNKINNALYRSFVEIPNKLIPAFEAMNNFINDLNLNLIGNQSNQNTTAS